MLEETDILPVVLDPDAGTEIGLDSSMFPLSSEFLESSEFLISSEFFESSALGFFISEFLVDSEVRDSSEFLIWP